MRSEIQKLKDKVVDEIVDFFAVDYISKFPSTLEKKKSQVREILNKNLFRTHDV